MRNSSSIYEKFFHPHKNTQKNTLLFGSKLLPFSGEWFPLKKEAICFRNVTCSFEYFCEDGQISWKCCWYFSTVYVFICNRHSVDNIPDTDSDTKQATEDKKRQICSKGMENKICSEELTIAYITFITLRSVRNVLGIQKMLLTSCLVHFVE
jgi:hypothetical protein